MGLPAMFLMAFGLSMDAFAVSVSSGTQTRECLWKRALLMGLFFGGFQALMPAIGWFVGAEIHEWVMSIDHWIAFILLSLLGLKMIHEGFKNNDDTSGKFRLLTLRLLLILSIATSIDALAVGFSMSCVGIGLLSPIIIIGTVTFIISGAGVLIGHRFGKLLGNKCEFVGGGILIGIGIKLLIEHTFS